MRTEPAFFIVKMMVDPGPRCEWAGHVVIYVSVASMGTQLFSQCFPYSRHMTFSLGKYVFKTIILTK